MNSSTSRASLFALAMWAIAQSAWAVYDTPIHCTSDIPDSKSHAILADGQKGSEWQNDNTQTDSLRKRADFQLHVNQLGKVIGNKVSTVNLWDFHSLPDGTKEEGADLTKFVEHVQFMQATGGNAERDLFLHPTDHNVLDDYDFMPLIAACHRVLSLHAKPHIKLSVPDKFSQERKIEDFGVDVLPPDDYEVYYRYIQSMAETLVKEFGKEEVRTWGWGVLVEFENASWFHDKDKTPEGSRDAYFKLYDYSFAALSSILGDDIYIGGHAMACTEGLWDERELLNHCVNDVNAKTGKKGTPIRYFAVSFYDDAPDKPHPLTLVQTIERIRQRAKELGLNNLRYGVDEGRILGATKGHDATDLVWRIVGNTYQAAYDARIFKILADNDIDYFSAWSYSSAGAYNGYPLIAYRIAEKLYEFKEDRQVNITSTKQIPDETDCEAVAGFDEQGNCLHVVAYNFKFDLQYTDSVEATFTCDVPFWKRKKVEVTETLIDDHSNFFCEWLKDKEKYGIPDDAFHWSPLSGCLDMGFSDANTRQFYYENLRAKYVKMANTAPSSITQEIKVKRDGKLCFSTILPPHGVIFYTIKIVK